MVGFGLDMVSVRPLSRELLLNCIEKLSIHDRWLLARQDFTSVFDLTDIEPVPQQIKQRSAFEQNAAAGSAVRKKSFLCSDVLISQGPHQSVDAAELEIALVDQPD